MGLLARLDSGMFGQPLTCHKATEGGAITCFFTARLMAKVQRVRHDERRLDFLARRLLVEGQDKNCAGGPTRYRQQASL